MNASKRQERSLDPELYRRYLAALTLFHQAAADSVGLSGTDYQASNLLELDGPMASSELARRLGLSLAAGSRLADRLVEAGVARRHADSTDRRRVIIEHSGVLPGELARTLDRVREPIAPRWHQCQANSCQASPRIWQPPPVLTHSQHARSATCLDFHFAE